MKRGMWAGKILLMALAAISFIFIAIVVTQYLWNWLVPELFSGPVITFWQTAGLLVLSKIFFWSFGGKCRCYGNQGGGPWKYYWKEKWAGMSPEERDRIKQKMKEKWCYREEATPTRESASSNG